MYTLICTIHEGFILPPYPYRVYKRKVFSLNLFFFPHCLGLVQVSDSKFLIEESELRDGRSRCTHSYGWNPVWPQKGCVTLGVETDLRHPDWGFRDPSGVSGNDPPRVHRESPTSTQEHRENPSLVYGDCHLEGIIILSNHQKNNHVSGNFFTTNFWDIGLR